MKLSSQSTNFRHQTTKTNVSKEEIIEHENHAADNGTKTVIGVS